jgi:hypothetical protein
MLVYLLVILNILRQIYTLYSNLVNFVAIWYIYSRLVCSTKKNLATLIPQGCWTTRVLNEIGRITIIFFDFEADFDREFNEP